MVAKGNAGRPLAQFAVQGPAGQLLPESGKKGAGEGKAAPAQN